MFDLKISTFAFLFGLWDVRDIASGIYFLDGNTLCPSLDTQTNQWKT